MDDNGNGNGDGGGGGGGELPFILVGQQSTMPTWWNHRIPDGSDVRENLARLSWNQRQQITVLNMSGVLRGGITVRGEFQTDGVVYHDVQIRCGYGWVVPYHDRVDFGLSYSVSRLGEDEEVHSLVNHGLVDGPVVAGPDFMAVISYGEMNPGRFFGPARTPSGSTDWSSSQFSGPNSDSDRDV